MKRKRNFRLAIYLLLFFVFLIAAFLRIRKRPVKETVQTKQQIRVTANGSDGFDRRTALIEYTKHAKCRMACRQITVAEVEDIMKNGSVNYRKTNVRAKPCPEYALEGYTRQDDQHVRIIFAQCGQKTKVVTCIDLDREFECTCN